MSSRSENVFPNSVGDYSIQCAIYRCYHEPRVRRHRDGVVIQREFVHTLRCACVFQILEQSIGDWTPSDSLQGVWLLHSSLPLLSRLLAVPSKFAKPVRFPAPKMNLGYRQVAEFEA